MNCEKEVPIDLEDGEVLTVVNGLFEVGEGWQIHLSKANHILDDSYNYSNISNAKVSIQDQNNFTSINHMGDGHYANSLAKSQASLEYELNIEINEQTISGRAIVPEPIRIKSIDTSTVYFETDFTYGDTEWKQVEIKFIDPPEHNYYNLTFYRLEWQKSYQNVDGASVLVDSFLVMREQTQLHINDADIEESSFEVLEDDQLNFYGTFLGVDFSDQNFNGREVSIEVNFDPYTFTKMANSNYLANDYFYVKLSTLSEDWFVYHQSLDAFQSTRDNPLAQPVQIHSNIQNGIGIFAGSSSHFDSLEIK